VQKILLFPFCNAYSPSWSGMQRLVELAVGSLPWAVILLQVNGLQKLRLTPVPYNPLAGGLFCFQPAKCFCLF